MQTDGTSEDSSGTENSDSEDEESKYAMIIISQIKNKKLFVFYSYERWLCTY